MTTAKTDVDSHWATEPGCNKPYIFSEPLDYFSSTRLLCFSLGILGVNSTTNGKTINNLLIISNYACSFFIKIVSITWYSALDIFLNNQWHYHSPVISRMNMSVCVTVLSFSLWNHRFRQEPMLLCTLCKVSQIHHYSSDGEPFDPRVSRPAFEQPHDRSNLISASVSLLITQQTRDVSLHVFYIKNVKILDCVSVSLHLNRARCQNIYFFNILNWRQETAWNTSLRYLICLLGAFDLHMWLYDLICINYQRGI